MELLPLEIGWTYICNNPNTKRLWTMNLKNALFSEAAELSAELSGDVCDDHNIKIEMIDILHFLVALSQLHGVTPEDALECRDSTDMSHPPLVLNLKLFETISLLQDSVKWKWWADGQGFYPEKAKDATIMLWTIFWSLCSTPLVDLSFQTMVDIYHQKNKVNFDRQENGYNVDTKTEADNLAIRIG